MIGRYLFFCDAADTSLAKIFVLLLTHRLFHHFRFDNMLADPESVTSPTSRWPFEASVFLGWPHEVEKELGAIFGLENNQEKPFFKGEMKETSRWKWQKPMVFLCFFFRLVKVEKGDTKTFGWIGRASHGQKYGDDHFSPLVWAIEGSGFFFKRWLIDIMEFFKRRETTPKKSRWFLEFLKGISEGWCFFLGVSMFSFFFGRIIDYIYYPPVLGYCESTNMNSDRMEWDRDLIVASFGYGSERGCLILGTCESHEFSLFFGGYLPLRKIHGSDLHF